jgi:predicted amidohydrolase
MFRVSVSQLNSSENIAKNLEQVLAHIKLAADHHSDLITFPENSLFFRDSGDRPMSYLDFNNSREFIEIQNSIEKTNLNVLLTTSVICDSSKLNATLLFSPNSPVEILYKKIHLFDVDLSKDIRLRESDFFDRGGCPALLTVKDWKLGQSICYDLRFSNLFYKYADAGCDVIFVPAAFLYETGKAHWDVLLRARAIESQCYVVAAAQAGYGPETNTKKQRRTFGRSMVVNPWGEIEHVSDVEGADFFTIELLKEKIEDTRRKIPMKSHRVKL